MMLRMAWKSRLAGGITECSSRGTSESLTSTTSSPSFNSSIIARAAFLAWCSNSPWSSLAVILCESSNRIIAVVFACPARLPESEPFNVGRENASTTNIINSVRRSSKSSWRSFNLRIFDFCNSLRNESVLNSIVLSLRRLNRCNKRGIPTASSPINAMGLRNVNGSNLPKVSLEIEVRSVYILL